MHHSEAAIHGQEYVPGRAVEDLVNMPFVEKVRIVRHVQDLLAGLHALTNKPSQRKDTRIIGKERHGFLVKSNVVGY